MSNLCCAMFVVVMARLLIYPTPLSYLAGVTVIAKLDIISCGVPDT